MAKKKNAGGVLTLKVELKPDEHKLVKMAAAELEMTIAEFLNAAAVKCANEAVRSFYQRELAPKGKPRSSS